MKVEVITCPIPIDRKYRGGWSGDPATRYVSCGYLVTFVPGTWEDYPNAGGRHNFQDEAHAQLCDHVTRHTAEDIVALHHWKRGTA